jgi:hypothetical protein
MQIQSLFMLRCTQLFWLTRTSYAFSPHYLSTMASSAAKVTFGSTLDSPSKYDSTMIIGKSYSMKEVVPNLIEQMGLKNLDRTIFDAMIDDIDSKTGGDSTTMIKLDDSIAHTVSLGVLPLKRSRHDHPMAVHSLTKLVGSAKGNTRVVILTDDFPIGPIASGNFRLFLLRVACCVLLLLLLFLARLYVVLFHLRFVVFLFLCYSIYKYSHCKIFSTIFNEIQG